METVDTLLAKITDVLDKDAREVDGAIYEKLLWEIKDEVTSRLNAMAEDELLEERIAQEREDG